MSDEKMRLDKFLGDAETGRLVCAEELEYAEKHSHKNPHNALCWRLKHAYKTPDDQLHDMKLAAKIIEKYATLYGELT